MNNVQLFDLLLLGLGIVIIPGLFLLICRLIGWQPETIRHIRKGYLPWLIIAPILVISLMFQGKVAAVVFAIVSILCIKEFTRATGLYRDLRFVFLMYCEVAACYAAALWTDRLFYAMPLFVTLPLLLTPIVRNKTEGMLQKVALGVMAVLVMGWFPAHLIRLTALHHGMTLMLFVVMGVALGDAAAFVSGKLFGRQKLVSNISPNKNSGCADIFPLGKILNTRLCLSSLRKALKSLPSALKDKSGHSKSPQREDSHTTRVKTLGGALGALCVLSGYVLIVKFGVHVNVTIFSLLILWLGGMAGDLFISFIKRETLAQPGFKDRGFLVPGHGGMLARFGSLLFVSPLYFYLCGGVL